MQGEELRQQAFDLFAQSVLSVNNVECFGQCRPFDNEYRDGAFAGSRHFLVEIARPATFLGDNGIRLQPVHQCSGIVFILIEAQIVRRKSLTGGGCERLFAFKNAEPCRMLFPPRA